METAELATNNTEQAAPLLGTEYLTPDGLARELHVSDRTLARWHVERVGPPRVVIGRTILYRRESVLAWLASREDAPRKANRRIASGR